MKTRILLRASVLAGTMIVAAILTGFVLSVVWSLITTNPVFTLVSVGVIGLIAVVYAIVMEAVDLGRYGDG